VWEVYASGRRTPQADGNEQAGINARLEDIQSELNEESTRKIRLAQLEDSLATASALRKSRKLYWITCGAGAFLDDQRKLVEVLASQEKSGRQRLRLVWKSCISVKGMPGDRETVCACSEIEELTSFGRRSAGVERWEVIASNFRQYEAQRSVPLIAIELKKLVLLRRKNTSGATSQVHDLESSCPVSRTQLETALNRLVETKTRLEQRHRWKKAGRNSRTRADARAARSHEGEMNELKERIDRLRETAALLAPLCGQPLSQE